MINNVEEKRKQLNYELKQLLHIVGVIDGLKGDYVDYKENELNEESYLDEQIKLVVDAKDRLMNIFKN